MSEILRIVLDAQAATWIAIASLAISIAALVISNRRRIFDQRLLGEKKATELRSLSFEFIRNIEDFRRECDNLEKACSNCEHYPEQNFKRYREAAYTFTENEKMILKKIDKVTEAYNVDAAIVLESLTAFYEDMSKRIKTVSHDLRELTHECPMRKQKDSSE